MPFLVLVVIVLVMRKVIDRHFITSLVAMNELYDLRDWIFNHLDDPSMSDQKWRDIIPMCRFADKRYATLHRPLEFGRSCEALVLRVIGETDEEDAFT